MKKLAICVLAALLCLCAAASAEDAVQAVMRGKTMIISMTDSWVQQQLENAGPHQGWWGDTGTHWRWHGRAAECMLKEIAGSDAPQTGSGYKPEYMQGRDFEMQLSRIGDCWYSILRLQDSVQGGNEALYELCRLDYSFSGGILDAQETACAAAELKLTPRTMNEAPLRRIYADESIQIDVMEEIFGAASPAAAVITEKDADPDLLQDVQLVIGGEYLPPMCGYMNGKNAVYCCMISGDMLSALESKGAALYRPSPAEGADFQDTPYAAVQKGTGAYGIVDWLGNWVIEPKYRYITRPDPRRSSWNTPRHFFCETEDGLTVLHGKTLQEITRIEGASMDSSGNPSVFTVYTDAGTDVYSATTGNRLFSASGTFVSMGDGAGRNYVIPEYCFRVEGYPERLVIQNGGTGSGNEYSFLADNHGNRIAGDYQYILPLMWLNDRGLYLTQKCEGGAFCLEYASVDFRNGEYVHSGEDSASWRCGLVDEAGRCIAPAAYSGVRIVSEDEVQLLDENGSWVSFRWMD